MLEIAMTTDKVTWFRQLADARKGSPKETIPQELADAWTDIMVEAVRTFHESDFVMLPAVDYVDNLSDEDVTKRIRGYQDGYDLEFLRRATGYSEEVFDLKSYDFSALPWPLQRSVVSHWDRLHLEYLRAHKGLFYWPDIGYVWLLEGDVKVPYRDMDYGRKPDYADMACLGEYGNFGHPIYYGMDYDL